MRLDTYTFGDDGSIPNSRCVPLPDQDPAQGANGPLVKLWRGNG
jgi:hypothetical protein